MSSPAHYIRVQEWGGPALPWWAILMIAIGLVALSIISIVQRKRGR